MISHRSLRQKDYLVKKKLELESTPAPGRTYQRSIAMAETIPLTVEFT